MTVRHREGPADETVREVGRGERSGGRGPWKRRGHTVIAQDIIHRSGPSTITRRLAAVALLLALVAAPLPGVSQSAGTQATGTTVATSLQVSLCPTGYAGSAYLDDCAVIGEGDVDVSATDEVVGGATTAATNATGLGNVSL